VSFNLPDYPHLEFRRCWRLSESTAINLGKCESLVYILGGFPVPPAVQAKLREVAFSRGAQATTAIEGNTLTDDELQRMLEGSPLPKSREYQGKEVANAINAMNSIWEELVVKGGSALIQPDTICRWNKMIGKDLGPLYDGVPGRWRTDRRHVGKYLAPPAEHVKELVKKLCMWLKSEFRFGERPVSAISAIQQAISAHVYFEWIHPFADGNGRTGRLLEFYVMLRAGFPDITVHVLANHYNETRTEYAAHFDNARRKRDLTDFMDYAIQGLADGLQQVADRVQSASRKTVWESHVYSVFANYSDYRKKTVFKRRRALALAMPVDRDFAPIELVRSSNELASQYMEHDRRTLSADCDVLQELGLMIPADEAGLFRVNIAPLLAQHLAPRAALRHASRI
jgi:Fic family protein